MNSINNNLMAMNAANTLNSHYGRLSTSVERLSSGLRINSSADDAAGLAIRELMRADVAALNQGMRNANDAISLIQVADGALGIIDEKLIRMKELAEQAATGTYNSTQRLMIDSEFQAMASEITRIARATDFNGIKILAGNTETAIPDNVNPNIQYEKYLAMTWVDNTPIGSQAIGNHYSTDMVLNGVTDPGKFGPGSYTITLNNTSTSQTALSFAIDPSSTLNVLGVSDAKFGNYGKGYYEFSITVDVDGVNKLSQCFHIYANDPACLSKVSFQLTITDPNAPLNPPAQDAQIPEDVIRIHFGAGNDSAEDYYDIRRRDATASGLGLKNINTQTQGNAQASLEAINNAIIAKDKIRADYGAIQNRLENTVSNLAIQRENLQTAESRISDVDVAIEMMQFVRSQVLTQSSVAMLVQANSYPHMLASLING